MTEHPPPPEESSAVLLAARQLAREAGERRDRPEPRRLPVRRRARPERTQSGGEGE